MRLLNPRHILRHWQVCSHGSFPPPELRHFYFYSLTISPIPILYEGDWSVATALRFLVDLNLEALHSRLTQLASAKGSANVAELEQFAQGLVRYFEAVARFVLIYDISLL